MTYETKTECPECARLRAEVERVQRRLDRLDVRLGRYRAAARARLARLQEEHDAITIDLANALGSLAGKSLDRSRDEAHEHLERSHRALENVFLELKHITEQFVRKVELLRKPRPAKGRRRAAKDQTH